MALIRARDSTRTPSFRRVSPPGWKAFFNHQMDIGLYNEMGKEIFRLFGADGVTKLLTIEASGIGIACVAGQYFNVPVIFAKKSKTALLQQLHSGPSPCFVPLFYTVRREIASSQGSPIAFKGCLL